MTVSVCVCLYEFVCLSASISPKLHVRSLPIFRACYLWLWLGSPLAASRYVMYFRFVDEVILAHKPRQLNVAAQLMEAQLTKSMSCYCS